MYPSKRSQWTKVTLGSNRLRQRRCEGKGREENAEDVLIEAPKEDDAAAKAGSVTVLH